ncbi:MAG: (2Fe-2S)-binding protein [Syntrophorhabdaceae bacterium]|nr:(2Fe-2S)-binding protein [Syntrophorhabdaceae bacterium]
MKKLITFRVNDREYEIAVAPNRTLTQVLREDLNLLGTKEGCGVGDCGACTVIVDGKPVNSCLVLAVQADGSDITTIEGVARGDSLHTVQQTFVEMGAIQCGFCTPGMVLSATSLLDKNPRPTEREVREAISGNLCRCTGYQKIVEAVQEASRRMKK